MAVVAIMSPAVSQVLAYVEGVDGASGGAVVPVAVQVCAFVRLRVCVRKSMCAHKHTCLCLCVWGGGRGTRNKLRAVS